MTYICKYDALCTYLGVGNCNFIFRRHNFTTYKFKLNRLRYGYELTIREQLQCFFLIKQLKSITSFVTTYSIRCLAVTVLKRYSKKINKILRNFSQGKIREKVILMCSARQEKKIILLRYLYQKTWSKYSSTYLFISDFIGCLLVKY